MIISVSGSVAYDIILDYLGRFADHIQADKVHSINLSFLVSGVKKSAGGTAGNIAYNLAMLGLDTEIIGWVGSDGRNLRGRYRKLGIGVRHLGVSKFQTATGYIITDQMDNQISGFYPGAMMKRSALPKLEPCDWPIIAAESPENMARLARHYQSTRHRYIFDPGQAITALDKKQIETCLKGASIVIGNDYEVSAIESSLRGARGTKQSQNSKGLLRFARNDGFIVIRTFGPRGSEIVFPNGKRVRIGVAKTKKTVDPTGAGDAYRAGLVKGIVMGLDLKRAAQLGATAAVFAAEKYGTQNHRFNYGILVRRHNSNFKDKI